MLMDAPVSYKASILTLFTLTLYRVILADLTFIYCDLFYYHV